MEERIQIQSRSTDICLEIATRRPMWSDRGQHKRESLVKRIIEKDPVWALGLRGDCVKNDTRR